MLRKLTIVLLLACLSVLAANNKTLDNPKSQNTKYWSDTLYIDGTGSDTSKIYWQDDGAEKFVQFFPSDDSTDGWSDDSAAVSIELLQVIPCGPGQVAIAPSRAHPDSAGWPYSSDFFLSDSLAIAGLDTNAVRSFGLDTIGTGGRYDTTFQYNNTAGAVSSTSAPFVYYQIAPDYTPGIAFKLTGKANNAQRGTGSKWIIKVGQSEGSKVKR